MNKDLNVAGAGPLVITEVVDAPGTVVVAGTGLRTFKLGAAHKNGALVLHRVISTVDRPLFGVQAGDQGGWVQGAHNLADDVDAWVGDDAMVLDEARCEGHVGGKAILFDRSFVGPSAAVIDSAGLRNAAKVLDSAIVCGTGRIHDGAIAKGFSVVSGALTGHAVATDDCVISKGASISGHVVVGGDSYIPPVHISGSGELNSRPVYLSNSEGGEFVAYRFEDGTFGFTHRGAFYADPSECPYGESEVNILMFLKGLL